MATFLAPTGIAAQSYRLDSDKGLQPHNVSVDARVLSRAKCCSSEDASERGRDLRSRRSLGREAESSFSKGPKFHNGTIEVDVAGMPQANAPALARGFVGIAFRVPPDASRYDYVYIRPTNGRADDQERRNHSTQYASFPDNEWLKLRTESPGKYESYVDLVPGEWTHLKIEVSGVKMRLYVNGAGTANAAGE